MPTAITTTDLDDAVFAPSPTGPAFSETTEGSTIPVNSILARKHTPNQHRGRLALVAGISMLALVGVAAGALAIMSHSDKHTPAQAAQRAKRSSDDAGPGRRRDRAVGHPDRTGRCDFSGDDHRDLDRGDPGRADRAAKPVVAAGHRAPAGRRFQRRRTRSARRPAPIAIVPPPVPAQPETPATNQMAPVVGPSTAPAPPPAQPVTPQTSATPQPQPATPQPATPQAVSDATAAPLLAKLPLSAILSQRT